MKNEQQIKYLERRLANLQQYVNREIEMILDDIKRLEWREEVHKSQVSNFKLTEVNDDPWRDLPEVLTPSVRRFLGIGLIRGTI